MSLRTPPPKFNCLDVLPELADRTAMTIRLNPRRGAIDDPTASKIGGTFLWPSEEPWPICEQSEKPDWWENEAWPVPEGAWVELVPLLQIRKDDFPDFEFYPDTDLMQILWCPLRHNAPIFVGKPHLFWHHISEIDKPLKTIPVPKYVDKSLIPTPCRLHPERILEYPPSSILDHTQQWKLDQWDLDEDVLGDDLDGGRDLYDSYLSACPGTKLGGYAKWIQDPEIPTCSCGTVMEHFLTISGSEWDSGTFARWCPVDDSGRQKRSKETVCPFLPALDGRLYIFICKACPFWQIDCRFQG